MHLGGWGGCCCCQLCCCWQAQQAGSKEAGAAWWWWAPVQHAMQARRLAKFVGGCAAELAAASASQSCSRRTSTHVRRLRAMPSTQTGMAMSRARRSSEKMTMMAMMPPRLMLVWHQCPKWWLPVQALLLGELATEVLEAEYWVMVGGPVSFMLPKIWGFCRK